MKTKHNQLVIVSLISILLLSIMPLCSAFSTFDDFETGDFSKAMLTATSGGTSTVSIVSDPVLYGSYSAKLYTNGVGNAYALASYNFASLSDNFVRVYINFESTPSVGVRFRVFLLYTNYGAGNSLSYVYLYNTGSGFKWGVCDPQGTFHDSEIQTFSTDVWYCLELRVVPSLTEGVIDLWLSGTQIVAETGLNTGSAGVGSVVYIETNYNSGETTPQTVYFDNLIISDSYIGTIPDSTPDWAISVTGSINGYSSVCIYGHNSLATDDFDVSYDSVAPPNPPSGLNCYFYYPDNTPAYVQTLSKSIISVELNSTWTLIVNNVDQTGTITLTWNTTMVPPMRLETTSGILLASMTSVDEYSFSPTADSTYTFIIRYAGSNLDINSYLDINSVMYIPKSEIFSIIGVPINETKKICGVY